MLSVEFLSFSVCLLDECGLELSVVFFELYPGTLPSL